MTLTLGWWVIPTVFTLAFFVAAITARPPPHYGFMPDLAASLHRAGAFVLAAVASFLVWLAYAQI